ncbi:MAG: hypothetical protein KF901_14010 [Myxococcales bacterium]|nr:hypothetical protein [Myxococcales bacterium]
MRSWIRGAALAASLGALVAPHARADEPPLPPCIRVSKEAPFQGYGYTHVVVVRSTCDRSARCDVATDVDPSPQRVRVAPGATERVVTRRGSPASEFQTRVSCTLEGR